MSTNAAVVDLAEIGRIHTPIVGAKAAQLAELARIDGIRVPPGFCVTTLAYRRIRDANPSIDELVAELSHLDADDQDAIRAVTRDIRQTLEASVMPEDLTTAITQQVARLGEGAAYAVRSSATAEDLPTASFAGLHDTYLNVVGVADILGNVLRCWASLFSERALSYRVQHGYGHRDVDMAVVVQQMVFPHAAGVLFTADPATSNRKVATVEATFGLGEALVSGRVNTDRYEIRDGEIAASSVATKRIAVEASPTGGTHEQAIECERQTQPALTDEQVVHLVDLGRRIEGHFGSPRDIEWCLNEYGFQFVQSRPITTLFPVPANTGGGNRVYISVGHQQMMTDAMKPLGLSVWLLTTPAPMTTAGGRLFVDVTAALGSAAGRTGLMEGAGRSDPLIKDALETVLDRGEFLSRAPHDGHEATTLAAGTTELIDADPALVEELIERAEASLAELQRKIRAKAGTELLDFIRSDIEQLFLEVFDAQTRRVVMTGIEATWWLNDRLEAWLGEKNAADPLAQSVPHNVTSAMGLDLLAVADMIRPHPAVVAFLESVASDDFLDEVATLIGGRAARDAIVGYLDKYGMRCVGEIDITRPRWRERPRALVPALLANVKNFGSGEAERRFEKGRRTAADKELELLTRVRALPDGGRKAIETKRMIDRVRTFSGYREYPKYGLVSRYFVYKQALLEEAQRLVGLHVLEDAEDIFYLTFQELQEVVRTNRVDPDYVQQRKDDFESYLALTPPRVLTSDGEAITGVYQRGDLPADALVGLAVSAGQVEGRARVVHEMAEADLEVGDILVTAYTDPSWTPLFVAAAALVTEVGGLMTHGAVIAREYGLPAVVGVERATELIRDGQRIRVDGTHGYVEFLT